MIKFAVAGNIASGKSTVEKILKASGFNVLDTDEVAHELLLSEKDKILEVFKSFDILDNNQISRRKLGKVVFQSPQLRIKLENILHPMIEEKIKLFFEENFDKKYTFVSIPLLFEANMTHLFDKIIFVQADDELRLKRLIERNSLKESEAMLRISAQAPQQEKLVKSDYVVNNNSDVENLKEQLFKILY